MKMTFLNAGLLATLTLFAACSGDGKQEAAQEQSVQEEAPMHEEGMQMEEMSETADYPIAGLSREEHMTAVTPEKDIPSLTASAEIQGALRSATGTYLALKDALVQNRPEEAKKAAETLAKEMESMEAMPMDEKVAEFAKKRVEKVKNEAEEIKASENIGSQRGFFATLSKNIFELNKAIDTGEENLYLDFCPMAFDNKGGYWISSEKEILNPYFGDEMLKCGRVAETL